MRPPAIRSKVDLPEPERPRRPRNSPARIDTSMSSRTKSGSPERLGKAMQTLRSSMMALLSSATICPTHLTRSIEPRPAFRIGIERPPHQTIRSDDKNRHDGDAERDARKIAGRRHARDVGAKAPAIELGRPPTDHLGDDAGVPRPTRCGDGAGHIIGKDPRQHHVAPPAPAVDPERFGRLLEVVWKGAGTGNDVEHDVPL